MVPKQRRGHSLASAGSGPGPPVQGDRAPSAPAAPPAKAWRRLITTLDFGFFTRLTKGAISRRRRRRNAAKSALIRGGHRTARGRRGHFGNLPRQPIGGNRIRLGPIGSGNHGGQGIPRHAILRVSRRASAGSRFRRESPGRTRSRNGLMWLRGETIFPTGTPSVSEESAVHRAPGANTAFRRNSSALLCGPPHIPDGALGLPLPSVRIAERQRGRRAEICRAPSDVEARGGLPYRGGHTATPGSSSMRYARGPQRQCHDARAS
jgi:hypothetical protein